VKNKLFGAHTGLYASELILGAAMFGTRKGYGAAPAAARQILTGYADAGGNFIDVSDQYQLGEAEEIVGEFIRSKRSDFIICTKYTRSSEAHPAISNSGNHRKAMKQAVEASLLRLRTDYIDIYMPHFDDGVTPPEEILRGMDDLVRAGKVLYMGLANFPAWKSSAISTTADLLHTVPLSAIQFEYNLLQRDADRETFPLAGYAGLAAMLYSPLAGGVLTGKYRAGEKGRMNMLSHSGHQEDERTTVILDRLMQVSKELDVTPGQVALAWTIAKGGFPIIGPRTPSHLEEAIEAANINLQPELLTCLDQLTTLS
jgi:aryl-alcohol dehydrogenase-like predicted oxidoreductase